MTCLGYALLHPLQLETAVSTNDIKLAFDDGVDIALAAVGAGGLGAFGAGYGAEFFGQMDQVRSQFEALGRPDGIFPGLSSLGDLFDEDVDLVAAVERIAEFLCELEPAAVQGLLTGLINRLDGSLPVFEPVELAARLRSLLTAGLAALEGPLLSGRDDLFAHRSYRAAVAIRWRIDPLLGELEERVQQADLFGTVRAAVGELPALDIAATEQLRDAGCLLRDRVVPLVRCAATFSVSVDVDVGGPVGQDPPPVTLADDALPAPHPVGDCLWIVDLVTGVLSLAFVIYDSARTQNPPKRFMQLIFTDLLRPIWVAFRTLARAFRWPFINGPPDEPGGESRAATRSFVRFLFSDFGDFAVQFVLEMFGSIHDMIVGWSNWISSIGLRLVKYYTFVGQPRTIYLFLRSVWYVREWSSQDAATRPKIPMARYAWLNFGPAAFVSMVAGWFFGGLMWRQFHIQAASMAGPVVVGIVSYLASLFLMPFVRADGYGLIGPDDIERNKWEGFVALSAGFFVVLIATLTLVESAPGGFVTFLAIFLPILFGGAAIFGGIFEEVSRVSSWILVTVLLGPVMSGVLTSIVWWYMIADGSDRQNVFDGLDAGSSPYRLPYPDGEVWLCGQNSHGFFSHQMFRADLTTPNFGNHYSYDLNEAHGSTVLAARTGLVSQVRDGIPDGNRVGANRIQVQHLDWTVDHDPGWDQERGLTYTEYLHLARRRALVYVGQLVRQGIHIADSDDTGISAMNHLHFSANSAQNMGPNITTSAVPTLCPPAIDGTINIPAVFREGKLNSLVFYRSTNTRVSDGSVAALNILVPLSSSAPSNHAHPLTLGLADLAADGTIPASVTLTTGVASAGPRHRHSLVLTRRQAQDLFRNQDVSGAATSSVDGHTHAVQPLATQPATSSPADLRLQSASGVTPALLTPPPGTLLARSAATADNDYQLLGQQMVLRVNGLATEWWAFGAHRAKVAGQITLDRGPGNGAAIQVVRSGTTTPMLVTDDLMAQSAAARLSSNAVAVRAEPIIVVETRRRGTAAALSITAAPEALADLTAGPAVGTGAVARLDSVTPAELLALVDAGLDQQSPPTGSAALVGNTLTMQVGGVNVTGFGGSTSRLERIMALAASGGIIANLNPLPLGSGVLSLVVGSDQFSVPVVGTPARLVVADLAAARLDAANLIAEPLTVTVRDDAQVVEFIAGETSPESIAERIMTQAEGVRAWIDGGSLVVETVAVGTAARLLLTKGTGTLPGAVTGSAPVIGATSQLADSTAISLVELRDLINRANTEATRADAPATVALTAGNLVITADASTDAVTLAGPPDLLAALNADDTIATDSAQFTGLDATTDLGAGGWLDVAVGGTTWRVDIPAEPARAELAPAGLPQAGEHLQLQVNGTAVDVEFRPEDVSSLHAVALRINDRVSAATGADDGVTIRFAYRYSFEAARHGTNNLIVRARVATSPGSASAGITDQAGDSARGAGPLDATAVNQADFTPRQGTPGRLVRAFSAQGSPITFTAADGGNVQIDAADNHPLTGVGVDPLGIVGSPAPQLGGGPFDLGRESLGYVVTAAATTTNVELNAAPAHLHSVAANPFDASRFAGANPVLLSITTTPPAGAANTAQVDLRGASSLADAAATIQRNAPHVMSWIENNKLDVDTRGGGTGWQLRLKGEPALLGLGFDPAVIDASGGISASGTGNVANGAAVTLAEITDIFHSMGGLATVRLAGEYAVNAVGGGRVDVTSTQGPLTLRSEPPSLATSLGATAIAGGQQITAPVALDNGWVFVDVAGRAVGAGAVWGRRAAIESHDPLPADLTTVGMTTLDLDVDGSSVSHTLPAGGFASVADLLADLNRNLGSGGGGWFGSVLRGGAEHLRIESRIRGSGSSVRLVVSSTPALGFTQATTDSGDADQTAGKGSVHNLGAVSSAELVAIVGDGRGFADQTQEVVQVTDTGTDLRLVATGGNTVALTANEHPDGLAPPVQVRRDVMEYPFPAPLNTGNHLTELQIQDATPTPPVDRLVRALLRAEPATLGPMTLPATLPALNGLSITGIAGGVPFTATFASVATPADVVLQVERAGGSRIRAAIVSVPFGSALHMETAAEGRSASLSVDTNPAVSTAFGQLGIPSPADTNGSGNVDTIAAVTAAQYVDIISTGYLGPNLGTDQSATAFTRIGTARHARLQSERLGCISVLEPQPLDPGPSTFGQQLAAGLGPLAFERSSARGPAVRASVVLPPFTDASGAADERTLNGDLWIRFNDNGAATDLAPPADVRVPFNGTLSAREAADAINEAIGDAGVGSAAAFPDETIVIETDAIGLAGSVTVPSPEQTSTAAVLTELGITNPLTNRGWPGAGDPNGRIGFRGHTGNALAAVTWQFATAGSTSGNVAITVGQTPSDIVGDVDGALRDPVGSTPGGSGRIGLARLGDDGALLVELYQPPPGPPNPLGIDTTGAATSPFPPPAAPTPDDVKIWIGGDVGVEPAFELRRTDVLRTFRMIYFDRRNDDDPFVDPSIFDPRPAPAAGSLDQRVFDVGWVRPPTDAAGAVQPVQRWASGRWLLSARAEAGRSDTGPVGARVPAYSAAGEMIISGGSATTGSQQVHFARQVRYWMQLPSPTTPLTFIPIAFGGTGGCGNESPVAPAVSSPVRVVRIGDEFFIDYLVM